MTPPKLTATAAKCARSCDGVCNTAEIGCLRGSPEWQRRAVKQLSIASTPMQRASGVKAIAESLTTGDDAHTHAFRHCTRCAEGQGDDCECIKPMPLDRAAMRLVMIGLVIAWCLAPIVSLRGCAA